MERTRRSFERLLNKFNKRKEFFAKVIARWQEKGMEEQYKVHNESFREGIGLAQELSQDFAVTSEGQLSQETIRGKVKRFKEIYKMLNEATKPVWRQWIEAIVFALVLAIVLRHTIFSPYHVPTGSAEPNILVGDRIWGNKMAYYFDDVQRGDLVIFDDARHVYDGNFIQYLWQRYIGLGIPMLGLKQGPINVVKRVVALPGDTVEGRIEDGKTVIYLNGKKLNESYVNPYPLISLEKTTGFLNLDKLGPVPVPGFLQKSDKIVKYTYIPGVPYSDQPFYQIDPDKVVLSKRTGRPMLDNAFTPIYVMRLGLEEYFSVDSFGPITLPKDMYWVMGDSRKNSEDSRYWGPLPRKYIRGRASFILFSLDSEEAFWLFDLIKHPVKFWTKHVRWGRFFKKLSSDARNA